MTDNRKWMSTTWADAAIWIAVILAVTFLMYTGKCDP